MNSNRLTFNYRLHSLIHRNLWAIAICYTLLSLNNAIGAEYYAILDGYSHHYGEREGGLKYNEHHRARGIEVHWHPKPNSREQISRYVYFEDSYDSPGHYLGTGPVFQISKSWGFIPLFAIANHTTVKGLIVLPTLEYANGIWGANIMGAPGFSDNDAVIAVEIKFLIPLE